MPAIKVRCAPGKQGEYRGRIYTAESAPFFLIDRKDAMGKIRIDDYGRAITAEQALSDFEKDRRWGWMIRMEAKASELADAQRQADLEEQPAMFGADRFNAANSGEMAGAIDLGGAGNGGKRVEGKDSKLMPKKNAEQASIPQGGPESGSPNLQVL